MVMGRESPRLLHFDAETFHSSASANQGQRGGRPRHLAGASRLTLPKRRVHERNSSAARSDPAATWAECSHVFPSIPSGVPKKSSAPALLSFMNGPVPMVGASQEKHTTCIHRDALGFLLRPGQRLLYFAKRASL